MMVRRPPCSAGIRYAKVFPVPVPASIMSVPPSSSAPATAAAIAPCPARGWKPGSHFFSGLSGPKKCSRSCTPPLYRERTVQTRGVTPGFAGFSKAGPGRAGGPRPSLVAVFRERRVPHPQPVAVDLFDERRPAQAELVGRPLHHAARPLERGADEVALDAGEVRLQVQSFRGQGMPGRRDDLFRRGSLVGRL